MKQFSIPTTLAQETMCPTAAFWINNAFCSLHHMIRQIRAVARLFTGAVFHMKVRQKNNQPNKKPTQNGEDQQNTKSNKRTQMGKCYKG